MSEVELHCTRSKTEVNINCLLNKTCVGTVTGHLVQGTLSSSLSFWILGDRHPISQIDLAQTLFFALYDAANKSPDLGPACKKLADEFFYIEFQKGIEIRAAPWWCSEYWQQLFWRP